jgi:starch synthase (maltosyl-transferring)
MKKKQRVIIEKIQPQLDCGQYFIKRCVGNWLNLTADIFAYGHDLLKAVVKIKHDNKKELTQEVSFRPIVKDEFENNFKLESQGFYSYQIEAWIDHPLNLQSGITKKIENNIYVKSELLVGIHFLEPLFQKEFLRKKGRDFLDIIKVVFSDEDRYDEACKIVKSIN